MKRLIGMYLICSLINPHFCFDHLDPDNDARKDTPFFQYLNQEKNESTTFDNFLRIGEDYDFIIIGSGSAGSVLANRLSEIPQWKILLLEFGHEAGSLTEIPMIAPALQFTDYNWGFLTEKQDNIALGLKDQRMAYPTGKALGGSTAINYMLAVRRNKEDYNEWERLGNPGWAYNDILKYFIKIEDSTISLGDPEYHGSKGYQSVEDPQYRTDSGNAWVESSKQAGYKYVDYNGRDQLGTSYATGTTHHGRRCSVADSYLKPAKERPNLTIITSAYVTKILIDEKSKRAFGVEYHKSGKNYTVRASKEVICSAGAFNSPKLLMLSGIGPKEDLEKLGINVHQDLPVGKKLYDHFAYPALMFTVKQSVVLSRSQLVSPITFVEYLFGKGPLTEINAVEAITYSKLKEGGIDRPDAELFHFAAGLQLDFGLLFRKTFRINDENYKALYGNLFTKHVFQVFSLLLHPKSFGFVKLRDQNPFSYPKIYSNFLSDPGNRDENLYIDSIYEIQRIVDQPAFKKYNATLVNNKLPACAKFEFNTRDYWSCALRQIGLSIYHYSTTCKMGPRNDTEAVVDPRLKVYGINGLRVVDASIYPSTLSAHINLPTMMVGEKAADMIKEDWGQSIQQQE